MQKDVEVSEITDIKDIDSAELAKNENAKFSFGGATLYGINAVIGSGIFLLPRTIYQDLGPASLVAMVLDAVLVLMLAVCFAEVTSIRMAELSNIRKQHLAILLDLMLVFWGGL